MGWNFFVKIVNLWLCMQCLYIIVFFFSLWVIIDICTNIVKKGWMTYKTRKGLILENLCSMGDCQYKLFRLRGNNKLRHCREKFIRKISSYKSHRRLITYSRYKISNLRLIVCVWKPHCEEVRLFLYSLLNGPNGLVINKLGFVPIVQVVFLLSWPSYLPLEPKFRNFLLTCLPLWVFQQDHKL